MEKIRDLLNLRIFRFLGVGGFCAGLSLIIMYVLTSIIHINYLISTVITIIVTNFIGFYLNKYYTFQTKKSYFGVSYGNTIALCYLVISLTFLPCMSLLI